MARPIKITEKMKKKASTEFAKMLDGLILPDGEIRYVKTFGYKDASATLWLTELAYRKIIILVNSFTDEVAWHGLASRQAKNEFVIEDILVYPQETTGHTVETDQVKYTQWLYSFDDEIFNKIRMQGHSHADMGVNPSGTDDEHRGMILRQLGGDMFYIFMIWNRALNTHTLIYDMENNILYDDEDIDIKIAADESFDSFVACAKENVVQKKQKTYKVKQVQYSEPLQQSSLWNCFGIL